MFAVFDITRFYFCNLEQSEKPPKKAYKVDKVKYEWMTF